MRVSGKRPGVSVSTDSIFTSFGYFQNNESWLFTVYGRRNVGNCVPAFFSPLNESFKSELSWFFTDSSRF